MKLFSWLKKKRAETVEQEEVELQPGWWITIGSKWALKDKKGDPFPTKEYEPSVVLDVKDGWVRYRLGSLFPDERRTVKVFLEMYEPVQEEEQCR